MMMIDHATIKNLKPNYYSNSKTRYQFNLIYVVYLFTYKVFLYD